MISGIVFRHAARWKCLLAIGLLILPALPVRAVLHGDVTADGDLDGRDALVVERHVKGYDTLTTEQEGRADVAPAPGTDGRYVGDGMITEDDALRILYQAVGLIPRGELTGDYSDSAPVIENFSPMSGPVGTQVTLRGRNFISSWPGENTILFGEIPAVILQISGTQLVAQVPVGASSGPLRLNTSGGTAESSIPFTVTVATQGVIHLGTGLNVQDFTVVSIYGETDADPLTGLFTLPLPQDGISVIGAVPKGEGNHSFLTVFIPNTALPEQRKLQESPFVVDARSTALTLIFLHPFLGTSNPVTAQSVMDILETVPAVDALASVIAQRYPQGANGLDDPAVEAAWQQAVLAVLEALPSGLTVDITEGATGLMQETSLPKGGKTSSPSLVVAGAPGSGVVDGPKGIDLDYLRFSFLSANHSIKGSLSCGYSPVEWLVALYRLDPTDMPRGLNEPFADIKKRNIRRLGYEKSTLTASNLWTQRIDILRYGTFYFLNMFSGWVGLNAESSLPLEDKEDGIYMIRAFSGSFKDYWQFSGDDAVAMKSVSGDIQMANTATGINVVLALWDLWGLVAQKESTQLKEALKGALRKAISTITTEMGGRILNELSAREALYVLVRIAVEAGKEIAFSYQKYGMSKAQEKLQGTFSAILGKSIPLLKILTKIAFVGKIGERIVGLMGYLLNPLDLEISYGPTPLETALVLVGDPFSPVIDSLSPTQGGIGTAITLRGKRFAPRPEDNEVLFGTNKAQVLSAKADGTEITIRVPEGSYSTNSATVISVETPASLKPGTIQAFYYKDIPVITELSVTSGFAASPNPAGKPYYGYQGTAVVISGVKLGRPLGLANHKVYFGNTEAPIIQQSSTYIRVYIPALESAGPHDLYIVYATATGTEETPRRSFTVWGPPTITSVTPTTVAAGGILDIKGSNLYSTEILINGVQANILEGPPGSELFATMPSTGNPGDALTMELWNPAGSATQTITRLTGIQVPALVALPDGLKYYVGTTDIGLEKNGLISLDEAMKSARGELNFWKDGYDDTNWNYIHHWYEIEINTDEFTWVEHVHELEKTNLQTNGLGHESITHYKVSHYHSKHGGTITEPIYDRLEDLDTGSDAEHKVEEGDRVSPWGSFPDPKTYNGANCRDQILTVETDQTVHAGNGILLGLQDKIEFHETIVSVSTGDILLKEGNQLLVKALQTSSPVQCTGNHIKVGDYKGRTMPLTGAGIVISSAFDVNISKVLVRNSTGHGIWIDHGGACSISGGVEICSGDGLRLDSSDQNTIRVTVSGCSGKGLSLTDSKNNSVEEFSAMNCSGDGFYVNGGRDISMTGLEITQCASGIVLNNCENFIFQYGMNIQDCQGNGITVNGGQANTFKGHGAWEPLNILRCKGNGVEIINSPFNLFHWVFSAGNTRNGIVLRGTNSAYNRFRSIELGRYPDPANSEQGIPLGNGGNGLYLYDGARNNILGEVDYFFNIVGNSGHGVLLEGQGTSSNTLTCYAGIHSRWNWITTREGNGGDGIRLSAGASHNQIVRCYANDNGGNGLLIEGEGTLFNEVKDTSIGTIVVEGGANPGSRANKGLGIYVTSPANYNTFTNVKVGLHDLGGIYCGHLTALPDNGISNITFDNCDIGWEDIVQDSAAGGQPPEHKALNNAYGVQLDGCSHSRLANVRVKNYHTGFHISGGPSTGLYLFLISTQCLQDGIYLDGLQNQSIQFLRVLNCGGNGVVLRNSRAVNFAVDKSQYSQMNGGHGLLLDSCQNVFMQGLPFYNNGGDGLRIVNCTNVFSAIYHTDGNGGDGVAILENSSQVAIHDGNNYNNAGMGVRIQDSTGVTVAPLSFQGRMYIGDCNTGQIWVQNSKNVVLGVPAEDRHLSLSGFTKALLTITGDATDNIQVVGCSLSGNAPNLSQGILINGGQNITIGDRNPLFGNHIDPEAQVCVQAEGNVQNLQILNNVIGPDPQMTSLTLPHRNGIGILLQNGINGVIASGNLILNQTLYGILIRDGAHSNAFSANEIRENDGDGILVAGAAANHNLFSQNRITSNDGKGIFLAGGNDDIAAPVINNISCGSSAISGVIHPVPPSGSWVEVYADRDDEGEDILGRAPVLGNNFCVNTVVPFARLFHAIVIHPDGNTSEFGPAIPYDKPDWYYFLFTDDFQNRKQIFLQNPELQIPTSLTPEGVNEWDVQAGSNGEGLVFTSDAAGNLDIWFRSLSRNTRLNLTLDSGPDYSPAWRKGTSQMAFVSERSGNPEIYAAEFDGNYPLGEIAPFAGEMIKTTSQMASDGLGVKLTAGQGTIRQLQFYIADLPTGFEWRVLGFDPVTGKPSIVLASGNTTPTLTGWHTVDIPPLPCPGTFQIAMIYSKDNQPLIGAAQSYTQGIFYYYTKQTDSWYSTWSNYYMIRVVVDPLPPTRLTSNAANDLHPAWSPDGQTLAFASDRGGSMDIWLMDADGSNPRKLTDGTGNNTKPAWSPDGSMIAFVSDHGGNNDIYTIHPEGNNLAQVTNDPADDTDPAWTPDGIFLLFSSNRAGNHEIYGQKPGGGLSQRLTWRPGMGTEPEPIPDAFLQSSGLSPTRADTVIELAEKPQKSTVLSLDATTTLAVALSSAEAKPGDNLELTVSIADARDLGNLAFEIAYDFDAIQIPSRPQMELDGGSIHALFPDSYPDASGVLRCNWVHAAGFTGGGVLLRIPIKIKADTQIARTSLPLENQGVYAIDLDAVPTLTRDGVVKIDLFSNVIWAVY